MTDDETKFGEFMKQREEAARAYVRGEALPLGEIVARTSPASFFGPGGGSLQGAGDVAATYARDAKSFEPGGDSWFEILQMGASGDVAYWVGFQHAKARLHGKGEVPMKLRVTEVFRREGDSWKLVHRHADMLADKREPKQT